MPRRRLLLRGIPKMQFFPAARLRETTKSAAEVILSAVLTIDNKDNPVIQTLDANGKPMVTMTK